MFFYASAFDLSGCLLFSTSEFSGIARCCLTSPRSLSLSGDFEENDADSDNVEALSVTGSFRFVSSSRSFNVLPKNFASNTYKKGKIRLRLVKASMNRDRCVLRSRLLSKKSM